MLSPAASGDIIGGASVGSPPGASVFGKHFLQFAQGRLGKFPKDQQKKIEKLAKIK